MTDEEVMAAAFIRAADHYRFRRQSPKQRPMTAAASARDEGVGYAYMFGMSIGLSSIDTTQRIDLAAWMILNSWEDKARRRGTAWLRPRAAR